MLGRIFGVLVVSAFVFGALGGNMNEVTSAAGAGAYEAVELSLHLLGAMCLWSGAARVLDKGGFTRLLERLISPLLKIVYPDSFGKKNGIKESAANISANFLGLGNAALPLGISAMKKFHENNTLDGKSASNDMVMFAVLATTPFQLLPVTLAAMREAAGSAAPYEILLPVWICEILTTVFAVCLCRLLEKIF